MTGVKKKMVTEWRHFDKILIILSMFFPNVILTTDSSAATTIQPKILSDFNAMTRAGIIATIIFMFIAGIRPVFAKLSVFGHLHPLILAIALHTLGLIFCALAKRFSAIFSSTANAILGSSGYKTLVAIILTDILLVHLRAVVTAYVSTPFMTNYYLGVEVANSLKPMIKHFSNAIMEMDVPGLVLICGGIIAFLTPLGMQLNIIYGWSSPHAIAPLVIGVVALAFFVYYESHLDMPPIVPFKLFKSRTFFFSIAIGALFYFTLNAASLFCNPFIQVTRKVPARTAMLL
ncbi:hypothetical protein LPJ66_003682 [Kickxella alabastrina]|uniref:Uncharacterized protein n=1 Tax=Kickxella alabastrina TaxID=61397 RepID=A0ACC1IMX9_9FUNG|nr:hypothetical protein LPJ66_003682 [Kickxella alabastrina]